MEWAGREDMAHGKCRISLGVEAHIFCDRSWHDNWNGTAWNGHHDGMQQQKLMSRWTQGPDAMYVDEQ